VEEKDQGDGESRRNCVVDWLLWNNRGKYGGQTAGWNNGIIRGWQLFD